MTIAPCPYPEMLQFTDADHDALALPFRSGPYWVATDGKILAWRNWNRQWMRR